MTQQFLRQSKWIRLPKGDHDFFKRYCHSAPSLFGIFFLSSFLFLIWPELDLVVSNFFYAGFGFFPANENWFVRAVYDSVPWMGRVLFCLSLFVALIAILAPSFVSRRHWRRAVAFVIVVVVGIGLLVHVILKDGMGRPRPRDIQVFAGPTSFVPIFKPSQFCTRNCSFVSGHAAVGYSLMSLGMLGVRRRRHFWFVVGISAGTLIGIVRIAQGGHFLSDVVFSFIAIWGSHLLIRESWLRFRARQLFPSSSRGVNLDKSLK